jgi:predicted nucleic acid-binding protein
VAAADLLVNTDVLIDYLRGTRRLRADGRRLAVSVVSRCELFAGRDEPALLRGCWKR